eukprot:SAG31_NODE_2902_length_4931_cov_3.338369_7_plen_168_part_00
MRCPELQKRGTRTIRNHRGSDVPFLQFGTAQGTAAVASSRDELRCPEFKTGTPELSEIVGELVSRIYCNLGHRNTWGCGAASHTPPEEPDDTRHGKRGDVEAAHKEGQGLVGQEDLVAAAAAYFLRRVVDQPAREAADRADRGQLDRMDRRHPRRGGGEGGRRGGLL